MYKLDITHPWPTWVTNLRDTVCKECGTHIDNITSEQFTHKLHTVINSFNGRLMLFDQTDDSNEYILFDSEEDAILFKLKFL